MEEAARDARASSPATSLEVPARALHDAISRAATIVVASEPLPDGDAFGAELALRAMIQAEFGLAATRDAARAGRGPKLVELLNEHASPARFAFLEGAAVARPPTADDRERAFDLAILVDGGLERCGPEVRAVVERCRARACVDHHEKGSAAAYDVVVKDARKSATTELLAALLETDAWRAVPLSRPLAEAIYLGLISDTGSFAYPLTTPATHRLAARILEAGARTTEIHERALLEVKLDDLKLSGRIFAGLETHLGGALLMGAVPLSLLEGRAQADVAFDRIVTPMAFVSGVEVTALLREIEPDVWRVSLRSRGRTNVADTARLLGGGGHARAAGCVVPGELVQVKSQLLVHLGH